MGSLDARIWRAVSQSRAPVGKSPFFGNAMRFRPHPFSHLNPVFYKLGQPLRESITFSFSRKELPHTDDSHVTLTGKLFFQALNINFGSSHTFTDLLVG